MNYQAVLESSLSLDGKKVGLGNPKPEKLGFEGAPPIRRRLTREKPKIAIHVPISDEEQPDVVVITADGYELKYKDTAGPDTEKTTSVRYKLAESNQPQTAQTRKYSSDGNSWIDLTTAHVFKRRGNVIDLEPLLNLEFEVIADAIPINGFVTVEVFVGTSAKS